MSKENIQKFIDFLEFTKNEDFQHLLSKENIYSEANKYLDYGLVNDMKGPNWSLFVCDLIAALEEHLEILNPIPYYGFEAQTG